MGSVLTTDEEFDDANEAILECHAKDMPILGGCIFLVMALDGCAEAVEECDKGVNIDVTPLDVEVSDFSTDLMRILNVVGNVKIADFMIALSNVFDGDEGWAAGAYRNGSPCLLRLATASPACRSRSMSLLGA